MEPIRRNDIVPGKPLRWPVYDGTGQLLLRKGYIVESSRQVDSLVERGLYRGSIKSRANEVEKPATVCMEKTIFEEILGLQDRLRPLYRALLEETTTTQGLALQIRRLAVELRDLCQRDTDAALATVQLHLSDDYSFDHPLHVAVLVEVLGEQAGLMEHERLSMVCAALTHDLGITHIQGELDRQKGPLSNEMWEEVRAHPGRSEAILKRTGIADELWLEAVRHHHERLDGSGYPDGLKAEENTIQARCLAIADIYSAMTRPRAYRAAVNSRDTLSALFKKRGGTVDVRLTGLLVATLGIYPPGTLLRLDSGEIAVSVRRGAAAHEPIIYAILSASGIPHVRPRRRSSETITAVVPAERFRFVRHLTESCFGLCQPANEE